MNRATDRAHCGTCGNACEPGSICWSGQCLPPGDLNLDCDVDLEDYKTFENNVSGPRHGCGRSK